MNPQYVYLIETHNTLDLGRTRRPFTDEGFLELKRMGRMLEEPFNVFGGYIDRHGRLVDTWSVYSEKDGQKDPTVQIRSQAHHRRLGNG